MSRSSRKLLGRIYGIAGRERVYRIPNGLEVDDIDHHEVTRKRVFFDEVLAVSRHQVVGLIYVVVMALLGSLFSFIAILIAVLGGTNDEEAVVAALIFAFIALPFVLAVLTRILLKIDVVTIYGKRTKATMHFHLRKRRGRLVYEEVIAAVRSEQERIRAELEEEVMIHAASGEFAEPFGVPDDDRGRDPSLKLR